MSEISLRQLKDEEKRDKIAAFFRKHKKTIQKIAILTLIIAIFLTIYGFIKSNLEEKYSSLLHQSLIEEELGNFEKSKSKLEEIYNARFAPSSVKSLSSLRYASMLLVEGKREEALKIYDEIAFSYFGDKFVQDLAGLLKAKILISDINQNSDQEKKDKTLRDLKKIVNKNKTLKPYSLEQLALFYIKTNQKEKAKESLEKIIVDQNSSQSLRKRVELLIKLT